MWWIVAFYATCKYSWYSFLQNLKTWKWQTILLLWLDIFFPILFSCRDSEIKKLGFLIILFLTKGVNLTQPLDCKGSVGRLYATKKIFFRCYRKKGLKNEKMCNLLIWLNLLFPFEDYKVQVPFHHGKWSFESLLEAGYLQLLSRVCNLGWFYSVQVIRVRLWP